MKPSPTEIDFELLATKLNGSIHLDQTTRILYATDASVYRMLPLAVVVPKDPADVVAVVQFATAHGISITPRTAGTSLAGQAVGKGLVLDFSVHFNKILEINAEERWVRLEPGVIRDELNRILKPLGLWFSPNTSSASRCMMGGMVGNNSSGTTSIRYGVTRDKLLEAKVVLSDGSMALLGPKDADSLEGLAPGDHTEGRIYKQLLDALSQPSIAEAVRLGFPKAGIHRRNTGYAVDVLLKQQPFAPQGEALNLAKLICGAEGTLCLTTEFKLAVDFLPPPEEAVLCVHFESVHEAMKAAVLSVANEVYACELMDKTILDCTKDNLAQAENRFFVEGDPGAILCIELRAQDINDLDQAIARLINDLQSAGLGHAFPVVYPPDTGKVWELRAAGLGVLSNVKGDSKPLAFVEDTAVDLPDLPNYIAEFEVLMASFGQKAVYFAHAGAGELHVRPVLNLKSQSGQEQFRAIGAASARLVKAYNGSLSGEHGDGRARSEFIPGALGHDNYALLKAIKYTWDPQGIFNPGNIVDPDPMDQNFRYAAGQAPFTATTFLDFSEKGNILLAAEACNGSGDCRKLPATGATMCPSYQATRNEKDSTRGRANMLREVLTKPDNPAYPWGSDALHDVLELCLSCKACKRECPSSVDMALLKAEADYHYQKRNGLSYRSQFFGHFHKSARWASAFAPVVNWLINESPLSNGFKRAIGIAEARSFPKFAFRSGLRAASKFQESGAPELLLYIDEFTQYQDAHIAKAAGELLSRLGFRFKAMYAPSARAYMSKAMLPEAKHTAQVAVSKLKWAVEAGIPVVGLEPSAILGFRDDLPKLFKGEEKEGIAAMANLVMTFEEFLAKQMEKGRIDTSLFKEDSKEVQLHLHCHQKALSHVKYSKLVLGLPRNYTVKVIPTGCCGMAGSFGYEQEHYKLSMDIGEMVLFPRVREAGEAALIVAAGTSCRHQIADGTARKALHPAELLLSALKSPKSS
jgi:FAD/FMN-containing dehydrogenase/Fe-S oxidoreductase